MGIVQYPFKRSNVVMILALPIECMRSTASSIGKSSDTLSELRALKSTQSRWVPSFLLTETIGWAISVGLGNDRRKMYFTSQDDLRIANDPSSFSAINSLNGDTPVVVFGTSR
ncbi:hypothetical protein TNCV_2739031 [Trichonephila clavipes]|nr:hypothetical protein TNCV_2739031 [Trichonephila clavipes]